MALIECPECGANLSDQAWSCPSCGAKNMTHWFHNACDQHWWWVKGLFKWVILIVFSAVFSLIVVVVMEKVDTWWRINGWDWNIWVWLGWADPDPELVSLISRSAWFAAGCWIIIFALTVFNLGIKLGMINDPDD